MKTENKGKQRGIFPLGLVMLGCLAIIDILPRDYLSIRASVGAHLLIGTIFIIIVLVMRNKIGIVECPKCQHQAYY